MTEAGEITVLLDAARDGDRGALDRVLATLYQELHTMARRQLAGQQGHTLDATSLVHDVFLRLIPESERQFADRGHFFRLAARAMRQIIVDHARAVAADKRGGQWLRTDLTDRIAITDSGRVDLLALDAALTRLTARDAELAEVIEAYFFAGFTFEEIAAARQTSERSIRRQWEVARLFLLSELGSA